MCANAQLKVYIEMLALCVDYGANLFISVSVIPERSQQLCAGLTSQGTVQSQTQGISVRIHYYTLKTKAPSHHFQVSLISD